MKEKPKLNKLALFIALLFGFAILVLLGLISSLYLDKAELSEKCFVLCKLNNEGVLLLNQCVDGLNHLGNASISKISSPDWNCYDICR